MYDLRRPTPDECEGGAQSASLCDARWATSFHLSFVQQRLRSSRSRYHHWLPITIQQLSSDPKLFIGPIPRDLDHKCDSVGGSRAANHRPASTQHMDLTSAHVGLSRIAQNELELNGRTRQRHAVSLSVLGYRVSQRPSIGNMLTVTARGAGGAVTRSWGRARIAWILSIGSSFS